MSHTDCTTTFKKTQDIVIHLRTLKNDQLMHQGGLRQDVADLIVTAASLGATDDDYINIVEIVAITNAVLNMTISHRDDLFAEVELRFNRDRKTFMHAVNEKKKAIAAAKPERPQNERTLEMVEMMNRTHANTIIGGKNVIMRKIQAQDEITSGGIVIEFIRPRELMGVYANDLYVVGYSKKDGEEIKKDRITAWMEHGKCIRYENGVYMLPKKPNLVDDDDDDYQIREGALNLWNGLAVKPKQGGSWAKIDWHIRHILAGNDEAVYKYILDWCAYAIQYPDRPAGSAIVFRGGNGIGKGLFSTFFKELWGEHGFATSNPKHIVGNFNRHLINTCLLFADEAFLAGNKAHENTLKSLITEPWIAIEGKGLDVINAPNRLKIMMATNSDWVVATNNNDRRVCVCDVSPQMHKNYEYFKDLAHEMSQLSSRQAFIYDMLTRDISSYVSGEIPVTEGLKLQRIESLPPIWQWWRDCLEREYVRNQSVDGKLWFDIEPSDILYKSYVEWCTITKQEIITQTKFGREVSSVYEKIKVNGYINYRIGQIDTAARVFFEKFGI